MKCIFSIVEFDDQFVGGNKLTKLNDSGIAIIGAGFAGFGASHHFHQAGQSSTIFEARAVHGGHTSTHAFPDGFLFDEGPHISFTEDKRLQGLFSDSIDGKYERLHASVNNYWQGHYIKHPAQVNLHGLPPELVVKCIEDFVGASNADTQSITHYGEWLDAAFGKTFAETFPKQYTRKYHTTDAKNLTTDWLGPRLYRPKLSEVLYGALSPSTPDIHYVDNFRYPTHGGFVSYLNGFKDRSDLRCGHKVIHIDPSNKIIEFSNGNKTEYEHLVSSVALPELVPLVKNAPKDVLDAASLLACTEVVLINIGVNKPHVADDHWTYFYDDEIAFTRLSYPSNFSPNVAPAGCSALQAEVYFSRKWKPRKQNPEAYIEPVIDGLLQCGLIKERSEVVHKSALFAPYANIIFDHDRKSSLDTVHGFLDEKGIQYCGRFGDWGYIWTDQAFKSGERAAERVLSKI